MLGALAADDEQGRVERLTRSARASPRVWPAAAKTSPIGGSPSRASATASVERRLGRPSACVADRRRAGSATKASRQPRLPQSQRGPSGSMVVWPNSPPAAAPAAVELAVEDHAHADAAAEGDDEEVGDADAGAEPLLGQGQGVDVVLDRPPAAPAVLRAVGGGGRRASRRRARSGRCRRGGRSSPARPRPEAEDRGRPGGRRAGRRPARQGRRRPPPVGGRRRAGSARWATISAPRSVEGGDDVGLGQLGPEDEAGLAVEGEQDRAAAAGGDAGLALVDQACARSARR